MGQGIVLSGGLHLAAALAFLLIPLSTVTQPHNQHVRVHLVSLCDQDGSLSPAGDGGGAALPAGSGTMETAGEPAGSASEESSGDQPTPQGVSHVPNSPPEAVRPPERVRNKLQKPAIQALKSRSTAALPPSPSPSPGNRPQDEWEAAPSSGGQGTGETQGFGSSGHQGAGSSTVGVVEAHFGAPGGPRFLHKAMPIYPHQARLMGREGTVVLHVTIDENGQPVLVEVVKSAGYGFDEEAVKAVKNSRFVPARKESKPIVCKAVLPIRFVLKDSDHGW